MGSRKGLFITATDTGVGKTTLATGITQALIDCACRVRTRKPVESGCSAGPDDQLLPLDATALHLANRACEPLENVVSYRFQAALSPARAASLEGVTLTINDLELACFKGVDESDFLLVEGAGGFYSPIASDGLNADLAARLRLPLLIVAPDCLGVISHILLLLEAATHRGLKVEGIVLNRLPDKAEPPLLDNAAELSVLVPKIPLYSVLAVDNMPSIATTLAHRLAT